jgi:hypothetical protein
MAKHLPPFSFDNDKEREVDQVEVLRSSMGIGIKEIAGNPTCVIEYQLQWGAEHVVSVNAGYFMEHIAHVTNKRVRDELSRILDDLEGHITRAWDIYTEVSELPPEPSETNFRITLEVEVNVSNFHGETTELPSREEVMVAIENHLSSGLFCHKEFAEQGSLRPAASIDTKLISLRDD